MDLNAPVTTIMSTDLKTARAEDPVSVIDEHLRKYRIHHVPVVNDENEVVGIVSKSEYLYLLRGFTVNQTDSFRELAKLKAFKVNEIMESDVETVLDSATVKEVVAILAENRFRSLPVVDGQSKLVGIVTTHDVEEMVNQL